MYSGIDIESLRRKANGTNMPGAPVEGRIHLCPAGAMGCTVSPVQPGNLDTTPNRASKQEACTRAPGKKPAVSLLPRILRASRRSGVWVDMRQLP